MEHKIESLLTDLKFSEICTCIDQEECQVEMIAKWICSNILVINVKMLEKCKKGQSENPNINIMDKVNDELGNTKNIELISCTKSFISLLHKIILHFDKINLETNKMIYEIYLTTSLRVLIFSNENNFFIQNSVLHLIHDLSTQKKKISSNYAYSYELTRHLQNLYFFINLSDFIYLHAILIYLCVNMNSDLSNECKKDTEHQILQTLNKINHLFDSLIICFYTSNGEKQKEVVDIYNSEEIFSESHKREVICVPINDHSSDTNCLSREYLLSDTMNKIDIKIIHKTNKTFHLVYKNIQISFDTNKYPHNEIQFRQNYTPENVNINNFLLLLKILSPNFLVWVSNDAIKKSEENNEGESTISDNEKKQCYKLFHMYIIEISQNYNYIKETSESIFLFYFLICSLCNMGKNKWCDKICKLMEIAKRNFNVLLKINNYNIDKKSITRIRHISERNTERKDDKNRGKVNELIERTILNEFPSKEEARSNPKLPENFLQNFDATSSDSVGPIEGNPMELREIHKKLYQISWDSIWKKKNKILLKMKSLIIWGYIQPDDVDEWSFLNSANSFIFTDDIWSNYYKSGKYINEYIFKKNNFFTYNYTVFKSTYECKTLCYKYMDFFSDFVALLILNMISALTKFYLLSDESSEKDENKMNSQKNLKTKKKQEKHVSSEAKTMNSPYEEANPVEENRTNKSPKINSKNGDTKKCKHMNNCNRYIIPETSEYLLEQLSQDIMNIHFPFSISQTNEMIEAIFNDFLFICFKLISYPCEEIQMSCLEVISLLIQNINRASDSYVKYMNRKTENLISLIDSWDVDYDGRDNACSYRANLVVQSYVHLICKINKKININMITSFEKLINICSLKNYNKNICIIICKNIIPAFYYHPLLFPFLLHKYMNIIFYLTEANDINIVVDSLRCLFLLFQINSEDVKIYHYDIVYRLHLLFNVFNKTDLDSLKNSFVKFNSTSRNNDQDDNPHNVIKFLKKFYFHIKKVDKDSSQILMHIKLILRCIYKTTSVSHYYQLICIFEDNPQEFKQHSKDFHIFATF
ncbi:hypothetical protein, conserved [Plasmodium gonderi]|uniref:Uncharacterized protein n=1 Tax=Plasmodium gonderi TaxID=77519 RepID=A0A1Y1JLG2_PLAGO|nr:hypothetical protein, conserved [Plasmodium gonderi]GAW83309.1 hypothetical protein, conserved [Plasmodium gonderi]